MDWLTVNWIVANWMPLLVALALGFVLGWLLTGIAPARRAAAADLRNAELEATRRKAERDVADLRSASDKLQTRLANREGDLEEMRARILDLEQTLAARPEPAAPTEPAAEPAADAAPAEALEAAEAEALTALAEADDARAFEVVIHEIEPAAAYALAPDQIGADFAAVARAPEPIAAPDTREIALNEAYSRVAHLQQDLDARDQLLAQRQAELEALKAEVLTANAARHELDNRLVRAREDVASELAVLASTMIKMKDDALARAEARTAALQAELEALRAGSASAAE